jgi:hypothetical protein
MPPSQGSVSGSLPAAVTITDNQPFNELNQTFTYASSFTFSLTLTTFANGNQPSFSLALLDKNGALFSDTGTGANSLEVDVDASGAIASVLTSQFVTVQLATPEPSSALLFGTLGLVMAGHAARSKRKSH